MNIERLKNLAGVLNETSGVLPGPVIDILVTLMLGVYFENEVNTLDFMLQFFDRLPTDVKQKVAAETINTVIDGSRSLHDALYDAQINLDSEEGVIKALLLLIKGGEIDLVKEIIDFSKKYKLPFANTPQIQTILKSLK